MTETKSFKETVSGEIPVFRESFDILDCRKGHQNVIALPKQENVTQRSVINRKRQCPFSEEKFTGTQRQTFHQFDERRRMLVKIGGKLHFLNKEEVLEIITHAQSSSSRERNTPTLNMKDTMNRIQNGGHTSKAQTSYTRHLDNNKTEVSSNVNWYDINNILSIPKEMSENEGNGGERQSTEVSNKKVISVVPKNKLKKIWLHAATENIRKEEQRTPYPQCIAQSAQEQRQFVTEVKAIESSNREDGLEGDNRRKQDPGNGVLSQTGVDGSMRTDFQELSQAQIRTARKQARLLFYFHALRHLKRK